MRVLVLLGIGPVTEAVLEVDAKILDRLPRQLVDDARVDARGESTADLSRRLAGRGLKLNVTALMTLEQVRHISQALAGGPPACVSVFAGRVADTGIDPVELMKTALEILAPYPNIELIWASPRELLNIVQADSIGCHIITVTNDILAKLPGLGKDLTEYSLDTVKMFYRDAVASGFTL